MRRSPRFHPVVQRARRGALVLLAAVVAVTATAHAAGEKRSRKPVRSAAPDTTLGPGGTSGAARPAEDSSTVAPGSDAERAVRRKTVAYDLVRFGQDVHIHADEVVRGDVVLVGGDLRVEGEIVGGAVALGGNIEIGARAQIGGEAISVGGRVDAAPGAEVRGGNVSLSFLPKPLVSGVDWQRAKQVGAILGDFFQLGFLLLCAAVFTFLGMGSLQRATGQLQQSLWRCMGLGVLVLTGGLFSIVMLIVLLALSLVGLPLALILAPATVIFLAASLLVGVTRLGAALREAFHWQSRSVLGAAALGVVALLLPKLLADGLALVDLAAAGTTLRFVNAVLTIGALAGGLGALVLSRVGARQPRPAPGVYAAAAIAPPASRPPAAAAPGAG